MAGSWWMRSGDETTFSQPGITKLRLAIKHSIGTQILSQPHLSPGSRAALWFLCGHWFLSTLHKYSRKDECDFAVHVGMPIEQL